MTQEEEIKEKMKSFVKELNADEFYELIIAIRNQYPLLVGNIIMWLMEKDNFQ